MLDEWRGLSSGLALLRLRRGRGGGRQEEDGEDSGEGRHGGVGRAGFGYRLSPDDLAIAR